MLTDIAAALEFTAALKLCLAASLISVLQMRRKRMQKDYHFSAQFTADLISMNTADFIIASTYRALTVSCAVLLPAY